MLAATLLLVFPDEEHAFHTLVALLSSPHLLPLDYFSTSLLASRADQVVLSQYVKKLLPRVWGKMEREGVALESVSWGWFGGIFGGCLGVEVGLSWRDTVAALKQSRPCSASGTSSSTKATTWVSRQRGRVYSTESLRSCSVSRWPYSSSPNPIYSLASPLQTCSAS